MLKGKKTSGLPGFGLTLGLSMMYMSLLVLIPLFSLILYSVRLSPGEYWQIITNDRVLAAFRVSFSSALFAALIDGFFGFIIAWVLTRYSFYGKRVIDALIDLPFAIPTAVAGITLSYLFTANSRLGRFLMDHEIEIGLTNAGIVIALTFIGLPFVVRTVQPVLQDFDKELEEASASLGANFYKTFLRVILPSIAPALITGFAMAFARGLGEYGSVIFIATNMPYESEIVPRLIVQKLLNFDYKGASAIGTAMLACAFTLLLIINLLQHRLQRRII
ncbi:MAG: sulfate ABC transporter permease subunit CysT [Deferribacteraceae bacterium]|jgi:sulfate transport system permease protein|nr:sulfate ABC transporter permease subunit CysT [Deferribacteraceae bacterium]